ncbi:transcription-repair coupling factor [Salinicoccus roseus]|uniref:Transcription-repair-coupling factor n=2 Tax=Salinicoccus roseus TaxID=45670 RepID=A0A0C2H9H6_9STAP|nr:transcription-repair coupling factor [Salinicoccus roseus]KIH70425.1 transcription-repair coupling factor [Salinicoccus roseus]MDB0580973.1 transcription-repair coupling factor [Salinicoccus roseus]
MNDKVSQRIQNDERFLEVAGHKDGLNMMVTGINDDFKPALLYELVQAEDRPVVLFVQNNHQMEKLANPLMDMMDNVHTFPVGDIMIENHAKQSPEFMKSRMSSLFALAHKEPGLFVVPVHALLKPVMPKEKLLSYERTIEVGSILDYDQFIEDLVSLGYRRMNQAVHFGEFAVRGDIIDIYMPEQLVRLELFDDEVDSLRSIDAETQRSIENISSITMEPYAEYIIEREERARLLEKIQTLYQGTREKLDQTGRETLDEYYDTVTHPDQTFNHLVHYSRLLTDRDISILDYISDEHRVIIDEVKNMAAAYESEFNSVSSYYESMVEAGRMFKGGGNFLEGQYERLLSLPGSTYFTLFTKSMPVEMGHIVKISVRPTEIYYGQYDILASNLNKMLNDGYMINIVLRDEDEIDKTRQLLEDLKIPSYIEEIPVDSGIVLTQGTLSKGFILPFMKVAVLGSKELYNKTARKKKRAKKISNAEKIKSYQELNVGDYVVHVHHGVGRYLGIETLEVGGIHNDYMKLQYKGTDQLYIPVDQMDLVQKYIASDDGQPKMHKLGGTEWKKTKAKVEANVNEIAEELIKLYQERSQAEGFSFSDDTDMQSSFEERFPYEPTPDQSASINEIKKDMESLRPMDRLLCGDVGYGKTEVAIRAAFKAVQDGKQVAFLVPTTILAAQHYENMIERIEDFPINVDMMSRFRTSGQLKKTKEGLKKGTVDIVVGTHKILGKDVEFKDLGLLIVDEEQRFGVRHKEKIKQLRTNVDVLTLTATPIPRTLHMSLSGVRDLSVIETPPENRFPVQTYVLEYQADFVREAIERELARDGQVFYLHNRVDTIYQKKAHVEAMVPDAEVGVMHAKMNEKEVEETMMAFVNGEYDVLVTTTIIETGVDVPNANTLIIEDADRFGLSQLYQLRGRVGRSNRISYAYLFHQPDKVLTEVAEKRLEAIKEYTELGSGFKIAMRDLNIRGAGNLLGKHQSGFIDSVGYELYSEMLETAVKEKQGEAPEPEPVNIPIDVTLDAYIPASYISHEQSKIDIYKRLRKAESIEVVRDIEDELLDRFGDYPVEVERLLQLVRIKVYALMFGIYHVKEDKRNFYLHISKQATSQIDGEKLFMDTQEFGRIMNISVQDGEMRITIRSRDVSQLVEILKAVQDSRMEEAV